MNEISYLEEEKHISKAFLNYDVIFYTFRDIKDYLKNLSRPGRKLGNLGNFFPRSLNPSFRFWM